MRSDRDNIKAGVFVVLGVVLGLVVIFVLSDFNRLLEKQQEVTVYYKLSDGIRGLKVGAQVTLGDQPVGSVIDIVDTTLLYPADAAALDANGEPQLDPNRVIGKLVTFEFPEKYVLFQNASIELVVPPLGSGTVLNIRSVGHGERYVAGTPIRGGLAPSQLTQSLMKEAGIEQAQREQIKNIIANVDRITTVLDRDMPTIAADVKAAVAKASPLLEKADAGMTDLRGAAKDVQAVTASVRERYGPWLDNVDSITGKARAALERVDKIVTDKDAALRESIDNLHAASGDVKVITASVKENNLQQFTELLDRADRAIANFETTGKEINSVIAGQRPVIERMVANLNLTAGQLKLAAIEVRRSPWRLLYRPSDEELETDNLYDATRSFALAAEALEATSANLKALALRGDDAATVEQSVEQLSRIFSKFEQAEDDFWQALRRAGKSSAASQLEAEAQAP